MTGVSRHNGRPDMDPPEAPLTSRYNGVKRLKGERGGDLQLIPHYADRLGPLESQVVDAQ